MAIVKLRAGETVLVAATVPGQGPDQGLPEGPDLGLGTPTHPIILPGNPTHPIARPPGAPSHPIAGPPSPPGHPSHPIVELPSHPITLPPPGEIPPPIDGGNTPGWEVTTAWTPVTGWIVVALPTGEHVAPAKR